MNCTCTSTSHCTAQLSELCTQYSYYNTVYSVNDLQYSRVAMAEWLARRTPNHKIMGSSPAKSQSAHQNLPVWAASGDNGASVHSAINEYLAIDRDGNCT